MGTDDKVEGDGYKSLCYLEVIKKYYSIENSFLLKSKLPPKGKGHFS